MEYTRGSETLGTWQGKKGYRGFIYFSDTPVRNANHSAKAKPPPMESSIDPEEEDEEEEEDVPVVR